MNSSLAPRLALTILASAVVLAPAYGQETAADEPLRVQFRTTDAQEIERLLSESEEQLLLLATEEPSTPIAADIVFNETMPRQAFTDWMAGTSWLLRHFESRTRIGNDLHKFLFRDVDQFEGSLDEKLTHFEEFHRRQLQEMIGVQRERLSSRAVSQQQRQSVASLIEQYETLLDVPLAFHQVQVVAPASALHAVLVSDPNVRAVIIDKSRSEQAYQNRDAMRRRPLEFPQPDEAVTARHGKPIAAISPESDSAVALASSPWPCGPGVPGETNCPPDVTWAPAAEADFASVVWNYGGEEPFVEGYVYSWVEWSTAVEAGVVRNTAAYKATGMPHCDPDFSPSTLDARCGGGSQSDVVYVPNGTYESEAILPNWGCSLSPRTGTWFDRQYTCWTGSYYASNLPDWYADTTFFDVWTNFNAATGSLNPEYLLEGQEYYSYVEFWAWGNDNPVGREASLRGQIGAPQFGLIFSVDTSAVLKDYIYLPIPPAP